MERLTKTVNGVVTYIGQGNEFDTGMLAAELSSGQIRTVLERLAAYEDTGLEPEEIKNALDVNDIMPEINVTVDQLRNILQAEQDGRLVVLPCKVGDTVYQVDYMTHSEALKSGVHQSKDPYQNRKYGRKRAEYLPLIVREKKMVKSLFRDFGKTVFLMGERLRRSYRRMTIKPSRTR